MKRRIKAESLERFAVKYKYLLLGGGLVLGALLRLFKLNSWSIWFDESFTSSVVRADVQTGVAITIKDVHPPLYYVILKGWSAIFGYSDVALRSFSVACSLIAALLVYGLLKRLFEKNYLAFGGFFTVLLGPFGVRYAQEARMYMLATIFIVIATWAFYNLMEKSRPSRWDMGVYALAIAASLYTHYFTFPIVFAQILYAYIFHYRGFVPRWSRIKQFLKEKKAWVWSLAVAGVLYLPWIPVAYKQMRAVTAGFWIPPVTILDPFYTLFFFLFNTSQERIEFQNDKTAAMFAVVTTAVYLTSLAVVTIAILWNEKSRVRRSFGLLLLTAMVPILTIFFLSVEPFQPVYVHRYFVYFGTLWYGLLGVVLLFRYPKILSWLRLPLIVITLASFGVGLANVYRLGNFNYNTWQTYNSKLIMNHFNQNYKDGDVLLTNDIFSFYDAMHYNTTSAVVLADNTKPYTADTPYIKQFPNQLVTNLDEVKGKRIWYFTMVGDKPKLPVNWQQVGEPVIGEHAKITLYTVE